MPNAVVDFAETEKFDLKSCSGGYVELKRMSYGEKLHRQTIAMDMQATGSGKNAKMTMQSAQQKVAAFEFARCIVDHNLEDKNGQRLNFGQPRDVERLHPAIGEEIGNLIDKMNTFDEGEAAENFNTESDDA